MQISNRKVKSLPMPIAVRFRTRGRINYISVVGKLGTIGIGIWHVISSSQHKHLGINSHGSAGNSHSHGGGLNSHGSAGNSHSHGGGFPFPPIPNSVFYSHSHGIPIGFPVLLGIPFPCTFLHMSPMPKCQALHIVRSSINQSVNQKNI